METVTLKVQLGGFSVEVTGSPDYAEKKLDELVRKYIASPTASNSSETESGPQLKQISASEFVKKVQPKSQNERALALGYYLEKYERKENFSTADLADVCQKARQPNFTNVSDSVGKLVSQGLLMGAGERDSKRVYVLTTSGEDQMKQLLKSNP